MKKKLTVILFGFVSLGIGLLLLHLSPDPMAENLELARKASNAQEAAAAISANNKKDVVYSTVAYLFVGIGFGVTGYGVFMSGKRKILRKNHKRILYRQYSLTIICASYLFKESLIK